MMDFAEHLQDALGANYQLDRELTITRTFDADTSVNAVAVSSDGSVALSACDDQTLKLWDLT